MNILNSKESTFNCIVININKALLIFVIILNNINHSYMRCFVSYTTTSAVTQKKSILFKLLFFPYLKKENIQGSLDHRRKKKKLLALNLFDY